MGKINPGKKTLGRMELIKDDPKKPRGRKNVGIVKQDPEDGGRLGTRKVTGVKVGDVVGRSSTTGELRTRKNTNLSMSTRRKDTVRDIQGTPAEIAADKKRAEATKASAEVSKPNPNTKASSEYSTENTENIEEFLRIKKSKGGKVSMGRGMGKALRGGGKVMR
jgi:hypothetical protein